METHMDLHADQPEQHLRPAPDRAPRPWKAVLVALVAGMLLGGTLVVTQPAIAAAPLKWAKIWKQEIKPRADKRYYTKKRTEKRYERKHKVVRGVYAITGTATAAGEVGFSDSISFGYAFPEAPVAHYIPLGEPVPAGCSGTPAKPGAAPGHLCVFEETYENALEVNVIDIQDSAGEATVMGAALRATSFDAGVIYVFGSWAATPSS
jgi:hypothetical protein